MIGGHEGVGIIVALGDDGAKGAKGEEGAVRVGDRVGVKWTVDACGMCDYCRTGFDSRTSSSRSARCKSRTSIDEAPILDMLTLGLQSVRARKTVGIWSTGRSQSIWCVA